MPKFFVDVRQDLVYAASWSSRSIQLIFKVKRAPKQAYPNFEDFLSWISQPIQLIFKVKRAPKKAYPDFDDFRDPDSDVKNAKFFCGRLSRPCLCSRLSLTASPAYFDGQTSPEESIPLILTIFVCYIANHFLGDPDSDVKNAKKFYRRTSRPWQCIQLAIMANPTHFEGQTSPETSTSKIPKNFVDVRQYLGYTASWTSQPIQLIFKVKRASKRAYPKFDDFRYPDFDVKKPKLFVEVRQNLGDPDSDVKNAKPFCGRAPRPWLCSDQFSRSNEPRSAYTPFQRFSCATANHFLGYPDSDVKNANFFVNVRQDLVYASGCPSRPKSKIPKNFVDVHQDLGYASNWPPRRVRLIFKSDQFSRSNDPRSAYTPFRQFSCAIANHFLGYPNSDVKMPNFFVDVRQDLVYASGCPSRTVGPILKVKRAPKRASPSFRRFSCPIAYFYLGDPDSDVKNAKLFYGRASRPWLCIQLALTASPTNFQANYFLGYPKSDVKNTKIFCGRPSRPWLCIRLAFTTSPTHFQGQTSPEARIPLSRRFSCAIANHFWVIRIPTSKMSNFFLDVGQDLYYASSSPSRTFQPILKVKQAPKPNHFLGDPHSDVKNAKNLCGRPSRPCICIRLDLMASPTHFQANYFLGDSDFNVKNAKKNCGRPSRPWLCSQLALTASLTHFEGQTSPEACIPPF
uniref:Uncharacterized protein n=1 Tax=Solanum lycopersicum TaxID=4081 RepID=A0A3Q7GMT5_SOLLC